MDGWLCSPAAIRSLVLHATGSVSSVPVTRAGVHDGVLAEVGYDPIAVRIRDLKSAQVNLSCVLHIDLAVDGRSLSKPSTQVERVGSYEVDVFVAGTTHDDGRARTGIRQGCV